MVKQLSLLEQCKILLGFDAVVKCCIAVSILLLKYPAAGQLLPGFNGCLYAVNANRVLVKGEGLLNCLNSLWPVWKNIPFVRNQL